jgi:DNA polymerase III sliding clamp (beta) subunit (PCNA family)
MQIVKSNLLTAMKQALPGVESGNSILDGADTFIFKNGFIYSYNDNISVSVPFVTEKPLVGAIKAKDFYDLIDRFKTDTITIISKDGKWIVKNESARAELTLLESSLMEHIEKISPTNPKYVKLPERFFDGMKICSFNSNRSSLSGLYCNENYITSTDEIRINHYKLDGTIVEPFWISDNAAKELLKLQNIVKYCSDKSWVHFCTKDKTVFSCKKLAIDNYPIKSIIDLVESNGLVKGDIKGILPVGLSDAINRASTLSMNIESFNSIKLTFTTDYIEVYSERPSGKYTEKVSWDKPIKNMSELSILVDYNFFEQGIKNSDSFYLKSSEKGATKIVFAHANGLQIVNTFEGGE